MRKFLISSLVLVFLAGELYAEEPIKAKEVVVTATKTEAEIEDVPASITVITKEEIKAKGAEKIRDIIRFAEGINFTRSRGKDFISIRGMNPQHTLILIDGKRFTGEIEQVFELDRLTLENVERIEIVRGPVSALYGTDALGGVINIITKKPERFTFEISPKYGVYQGGDSKQRSLSMNLGGKHNKFGFSFSGYLLSRDPYFTERKTTYLEDEERINLALKLFYDLTKHTTLTFDTAYMTENIEGRSLSRGRLQRDINDNTRHDFSLGLSHKSQALEYLLRAYISLYDKDYENRDLATNALNRFDVAKRTTSVIEGRISKEILKNHLFTAGGEYRQEFFKGTRINTGKGIFTKSREGVTLTGSEITINYWAGYIQDEWQVFDNLLVILAIRYDDSDKFESEWSPRIGITYKILPNLRAKASYGHGFKSPSPRDLYIEFIHPGPRYIIRGNPNLKPEKSRTYEISLEGEKGIFSGRIAYFFNDVKDLIESVEVVPPPPWTPLGWRVFTYQNIAKAEIQGVEASLRVSLTKEISLIGSYAYLDAKDKVRDTRLTMRPKHKVIIKALYDNKPLGLKVNIWGEWIGDNLWQENPKIVKEYSLWYLSASKEITKNIELYAGVDNIFNKKDEDIPLVGSFYYGGIRMKF